MANAELLSGFGMTSEKIEPPDGVSVEDWNAYLKHKKEWEEMLIQRFENELQFSPPLPPWLKYSEYADSDSLFWRMGDGESYLSDYFDVYLKYASEFDLHEYKQKYPAPKDWEAYYQTD